jgi:isopentenyldiphosphate isomerase
MVAAAGDERVEILDSQDQVIEIVSRSEMRARRLRHRAVFVMVLDDAHRVLIHRRSLDKDLWPGWWDVAVGGVMGVGESWIEGAQRELAEEIGLCVAAGELIELGGGSYTDDDVDLLARCFRVSSTGPFVFGDGEVIDAMFVDGTELARRRHRDRFLPDSLALLEPWLPLSSR